MRTIRLVSWKLAVDAVPTAVAVAVYVPKRELAVAVTWAIPSEPMIAVAAERPAEAPSCAGLTENVTTPPATGSSGLIGVAITARGSGNSAFVGVAWGVLPATAEIVNP